MGRVPLTIIAAAGLLLLLLGKSALLQPPAPDAEGFDAIGALTRLEGIIGPEGRPHPLDSDASDLVRERLISEIEAMGYEPRVDERWSCIQPGVSRVLCGYVRNIVFRAGPDGGGALMISAHHDSVPTASGAGDAGIGVAVLLQLAEDLRGTELTKPVIFLLNDGEELGLLGAHAFVEADPERSDVDLVLNLEARGVRGPAMMFETSVPNGAPIRLFAQAPGFKLSNSAMTDLYKLLPNDTDVTEYLPAGYRAVNLALVEGLENYHTRADNIDNIAPESAAHLGTLSHGVLDAFMAEGEPAEGRRVFTDLWGRAFLVLPPSLPPVLIISVMIGALLVFVRGSGGAFSAALAPVGAIAGGTVAGWASFALLDLFRGEAAFWTLHPQPAQLLLYTPAIVVAGLVLIAAKGRTSRERLVASSFFWVALFWLLVTLIIPGASAMFFLPGLFLTAALIAGSLKREWFAALAAIAGLASAFLIAPLLWQVEVSLNYEPAFASSLLAALLACLALPALTHRSDGRWLLAGGGALTALALVAGAFVPAHTDDHPGHTNLRVTHTPSGESFIEATLSDDLSEKRLGEVANFELGTIDGMTGERLFAPIEATRPANPGFGILSTEETELGSRTALRLQSNRTYGFALLAGEGVGVNTLRFEGESFTLDPERSAYLSCFGRSCDGAEVELIANGSGDVRVLSIIDGLPPQAEPFLDALPPGYGEVHQGHQTLVITRQQL